MWIHHPSPIIKEEFFSRFNVPFGIDANAMVAIDHHHLGKTVGVNGMVGKSNLVAFPSRIHYIV